MAEEQQKKRVFRKFIYRGVELDDLVRLNEKQFSKIAPCRVRRKIERTFGNKYFTLLKKLRKAKKLAAPGEKPKVVKTHLRSMVILPEMVNSVIGIHNGKQFVQVEIKPEMIGFYLGEFSLTYQPVRHGRPGVGATHSSRFIPLK